MLSQMFKSNKGQSLQQAPAFITLLVVVGILGAVGVYIISQVGTSFTGDAAHVISNITSTILNFFSLMPVLGTVLVAVILLGAVALIAFLYQRNR